MLKRIPGEKGTKPKFSTRAYRKRSKVYVVGREQRSRMWWWRKIEFLLLLVSQTG